jgi:tripartite-type tricarboxylate transporter receptor subunit TctC
MQRCLLGIKGGGAEDAGRSSRELSIPDDFPRRSELVRSQTGNRGSFQRHGDWDSFGVARGRAMNLPRRHFLHLAAGAAALPAFSRTARAQAYPTRPIHMIVGFPAGNAPDIIARLAGQWLSERLGQQFVIENRPGFGSNLATEAVVRAPPDGYTLLMAVSTNAVNATLYANLNFNFIRDMAPVASVANSPFVMTVPPSFPAKTVPEFIAYAKANPGKINMASGGNATSPHIFGELFQIMTGVDFVHVPYRSGYMPDLLAGQVQVVFGPIAQSIELIRTGKLRALAVTTPKRLLALPDVPTVVEFVPGYEAVGWYGIVVPKNTPTETINKLNEATNVALVDPKPKARLADLGVEPMPMTPAKFGKFIADETDKWTKVIRSAGIKPD